MAEITGSINPHTRRGVPHLKKSATRIDLTPMVDLGFLLITFFIVTTTWSRPKTLRLFLPAEGIGTVSGESSSLTVIPFKESVFYYEGSFASALANRHFGITGYSVYNGIGQVIRNKQVAMDKQRPKFRKELMLMIKPASNASYGHLVDVLDEVLINAVPHYALMDITKEEKEYIQTIR